MTELTNISARIPVLPFDKYQAGSIHAKVGSDVTPSEFAAAVERLQQEGLTTELAWNFEQTRPTLRYMDGDVKVWIEGPVIRSDETPGDVEAVLAEAMGA